MELAISIRQMQKNSQMLLLKSQAVNSRSKRTQVLNRNVEIDWPDDFTQGGHEDDRFLEAVQKIQTNGVLLDVTLLTDKRMLYWSVAKETCLRTPWLVSADVESAELESAEIEPAELDSAELESADFRWTRVRGDRSA